MENVSASTLLYQNEVSVIKSFTPNFQAVAENGLLRPLPYRLDIKRGVKTYGHMSHKQYNKWWYDIGLWNSQEQYGILIHPGQWGQTGFVNTFSRPRSIMDWVGDPISWPETIVAQQKLNNGLLSKVQGQSLPVLMALKERKQTASLIKDTIQRLYNGVRFVRHPKQMFRALRGRAPTAPEMRRLRNIERRFLKRKLRKNEKSTFGKFRAEQVFLEYRFAWLPLIKDCKDMLEGLERALKHSVTKSARKGINFSLSKTPTVNFFSSQVDPGLKFDCGVSVVGHMKVYYMIDDASLAMLSQCQGIAATIWDGVPYSFLVDGIVNISKYLDLLDATMGLRFSDGYATTLSRSYAKVVDCPWFRSSSSGTLDGSAGNELYQYDSSLINATSIHLNMNRQLLNDFPVPYLEYPYRDFVTFQRIADIGALMIQAGRRML